MKVNIQDLVSRLGYLGLDPSSIVNLVTLANLGRVDISDYEHLLITLKDQSYRPFPADSEPLSIKLLLSQLAQLVDKDLKSIGSDKVKTPPALPPTSTDQSTDLLEIKRMIAEAVASQAPSSQEGPEVVSALAALTKEIQALKTSTSMPQGAENRTISGEDPLVEMDTVFVDPLIDSGEIEANVSIKSVKSSNALKKLSRLKKLKGEG
jgi:hypothetical protein